MSRLEFKIHPKAGAELAGMATSSDPDHKLAAAQLLVLLDLVRSHTDIRERLMDHYKSLTVKTEEGGWHQVDIKLIQELKGIADDGRFHTDAVRRIRDLTQKPADDYRVFFAPRKSRNGVFSFQILGFFHRNEAYSDAVLQELKRRYES